MVLVLAACSRGPADPFVQTTPPENLAARFWPPVGWAWGLIRTGDAPALRYGVAAPAGASAGEVVILTGYGETAEGWFETVRALTAAGYTVWVLEGAGQGGSARYRGGGRGYVPDFQADIEGLHALVAGVIRPPEDKPIALIASGTAGVVARAAIVEGLSAQPVLLLTPPSDDSLDALRRFDWSDLSALGPRFATQARWIDANPDLEVGGASSGWRRAYDRLERQLAQVPDGSTDTPEIIFIGRGEEFSICRVDGDCEAVVIPAYAPLHLVPGTDMAGMIETAIAAGETDHGA
jgi:lysophospholipase